MFDYNFNNPEVYSLSVNDLQKLSDRLISENEELRNKYDSLVHDIVLKSAEKTHEQLGGEVFTQEILNKYTNELTTKHSSRNSNKSNKTKKNSNSSIKSNKSSKSTTNSKETKEEKEAFENYLSSLRNNVEEKQHIKEENNAYHNPKMFENFTRVFNTVKKGGKPKFTDDSPSFDMTAFNDIFSKVQNGGKKKSKNSGSKSKTNSNSIFHQLIKSIEKIK